MAAGWHHFKRIAHGFIPCSQSSSTCSTALISPWNLVEERIQSAQARICAQCCGSWPVPINDRRVVDSQLALDSAFAALFHEYRESVYDLSTTSTAFKSWIVLGAQSTI